MLGFILFIRWVHITLGGLVCAILPIFWAYNGAQAGDSFGWLIIEFIFNSILVGAIWKGIDWILEKIQLGILFSDE